MSTPVESVAATPTSAVTILALVARFLVAASVLALVVAALWSFSEHPKRASGGASENFKGQALRAAAAASAETLPQSLRAEDDPLSALGPSTIAVYGAAGLLVGLLVLFVLPRQRRDAT